MPRTEHLVLCGGVDRAISGQSKPQIEFAWASRETFTSRLPTSAERLLANIPTVLIDLLEVASYVYAADSAISRGGRTDAQIGYAMATEISVRDPSAPARPLVFRCCFVLAGRDLKLSLRR